MRNLFRKISVIPAVAILPFLYLTLSFCCFKMPGAYAMADCCVSMGQDHAIQKGLHFNGLAAQPSQCHCEKLTESYEKAKISSAALQKSVFLNKVILSTNVSSHQISRSGFFNYQSPPKIVQNFPSFYLQVAVRPPPFSIL